MKGLFNPQRDCDPQAEKCWCRLSPVVAEPTLHNVAVGAHGMINQTQPLQPQLLLRGPEPLVKSVSEPRVPHSCCITLASDCYYIETGWCDFMGSLKYMLWYPPPS